MLLKAFRVQNFRSIKDTSWQTFLSDNINGLIGQNESGKSSVLEALLSFNTTKIEEDDIRSDDTFPIVSCSFVIDQSRLEKIFEGENLPNGLLELLSSKGNRINFKREWTAPKTSVLSLEELDLREAFVVKKEEEKDKVETEAKKEEIKATITEEQFLKKISGDIPNFDLFEDMGSLLPDSINLEDIQSKKTKTEGYKGAINFLEIAGLDLNFLQSAGNRQVETKISTLNKTITGNFRDFWSQKIGKSNKIEIEFGLKHHPMTSPTPGKPYLVFWINDGAVKLSPKQRSKGVRWFVSFYLELRAQAKRQKKEVKNSVLLLDEPGGSLHAKAQADVLRVFEDIKDNMQIVYTTHSPHLITLEHIYRLLAVQRADSEDDKSDTVILSAQKLGSASTDTLSPLYSLMGIDFSSQNVIKKKNNVILEEISCFYYLTAFKKLANYAKEINFLPATGAAKIPQLTNLFLGWGIEFSVFVDDDERGRDVYNTLKKDLFGDEEDLAKRRLLKNVGSKGIEDVFTKTDFKRRVLNDNSLTYSGTNSEYVKENAVSKPIIAINFMQKVMKGEIKLEDLDDGTQSKIKSIIEKITESL